MENVESMPDVGPTWVNPDCGHKIPLTTDPQRDLYVPESTLERLNLAPLGEYGDVYKSHAHRGNEIWKEEWERMNFNRGYPPHMRLNMPSSPRPHHYGGQVMIMDPMDAPRMSTHPERNIGLNVNPHAAIAQNMMHKSNVGSPSTTFQNIGWPDWALKCPICLRAEARDDLEKLQAQMEITAKGHGDWSVYSKDLATALAKYHKLMEPMPLLPISVNPIRQIGDHGGSSRLPPPVMPRSEGMPGQLSVRPGMAVGSNHRRGDSRNMMRPGFGQPGYGGNLPGRGSHGFDNRYEQAQRGFQQPPQYPNHDYPGPGNGSGFVGRGSAHPFGPYAPPRGYIDDMPRISAPPKPVNTTNPFAPENDPRNQPTYRNPGGRNLEPIRADNKKSNSGGFLRLEASQQSNPRAVNRFAALPGHEDTVLPSTPHVDPATPKTPRGPRAQYRPLVGYGATIHRREVEMPKTPSHSKFAPLFERMSLGATGGARFEPTSFLPTPASQSTLRDQHNVIGSNVNPLSVGFPGVIGSPSSRTGTGGLAAYVASRKLAHAGGSKDPPRSSDLIMPVIPSRAGASDLKSTDGDTEWKAFFGSKLARTNVEVSAGVRPVVAQSRASTPETVIDASQSNIKPKRMARTLRIVDTKKDVGSVEKTERDANSSTAQHRAEKPGNDGSHKQAKPVAKTTSFTKKAFGKKL